LLLRPLLQRQSVTLSVLRVACLLQEGAQEGTSFLISCPHSEQYSWEILHNFLLAASNLPLLTLQTHNSNQLLCAVLPFLSIQRSLPPIADIFLIQ
jgi:hypothetical protein